MLPLQASHPATHISGQWPRCRAAPCSPPPTPPHAPFPCQALRERGVACLVAPYEADAQMAYLALRGEVHAVVTEDSDLLAYGCPRVLYKLERDGQGEEVRGKAKGRLV